VECDDECDPHVKTPSCGGMLTLQRKVIQKENEFGTICPELNYPQRCQQLKCPIDCKMTPFTDWSKCSAECDGGTHARTRKVGVKPLNGGASCEPPEESESCNTFSCTRDCEYPFWTKWTPCTQACTSDGRRFGFEERYKHITVPTRGDGYCPTAMSKLRYQKQSCNKHMCQGDEQCIAEMDLFVAIDASGSMRETGYKILKEFAAAIVRRFEPEAFGREAVLMGAIEFGDGKVLKGDIISPATAISQLSFETEKVAEAIEKTVWQKGFTNLAQVFPKADEMSQLGRKHAPTTILVLTDGKPSFEYSLMQEVNNIKAKGVKIFLI